ncbi:MAG: hypothetical protein B6242_07695 [Anaerolineaceae bacterium 4572_78]|nr:MAG: hypothetical protein B6242_07695 [Anaerolineaceae bacterium 4572_78]
MIIGIDGSRAALAYHTGTETYSYQLILAMSRLATPDLRLRIYTHQIPQPTVWVQSPFVETRVIPFPRLWTHIRLAYEITINPPDVLFVPAHVLPLYCHVPAVVTVHDLGYLQHPETHTPFQRWYLNWTTKRHTRIANHIIADSFATKHDLIQYYHTNKSMIHVVHLGIDPNLKPVDDTNIRVKYGLKYDYVFYMGTLQPRKNLKRLIEAYAMISPHHAVNLVLAGKKGWLYYDLFEYVQQLNLDKRVIFLGFVPENDKAGLISGAIAYAFPSLHEGFGLPLLESYACGTPVLTSNVSSMPEIAGDASFIVDPYSVTAIASGLNCLILYPKLREKLVKKGFERVKYFSWDNTAQQIMAILTNTHQ